MPYLGTPPQSGFITSDAEKITGQTTNYVNLSNAISSLDDVQVHVNYVIQDPSTLTLNSTTQIGLGDTLVSSDVVLVTYLGKAVATQSPPVGGVSNDMLAGSITADKLSGSITADKLSSTAVDNTNTNSTLITAQTEKTSLADADKFLISDSASSGALKYVQKSNLGAGGLVKIHSFSVSSGDASATLTSKFDSTYDIYKIFLYDWNTSLDADAKLQWVTGTNTVESGSVAYFFSGSGFNTANSGSSWSGNDNYIRIAGETIRHDADEHFAWEGTLYNPSGTTLKKRLVFAGGGRRTGNLTFSGHGTAEWNSTTAITGFKIFPSQGTFDSLSGAIYGVVT